MKKIVIGLPAYNEEQALPKLFERIELLKQQLGEALQVVVVNDGSIDGTHRILEEQNKKNQYVSYIDHEKNKGLGEAVKTLFNYTANNYDYDDILVTLDADNTHDPKIIKDMCDLLERENLDLVIASRFVKGGKEIGVSALRKIFSRGAKLYFKLFFPIYNVNDYSSGFRAYKIGYLKKVLLIYNNNLITTNGFDCMAEILAKFGRIGVNAGEYPLVLEYNLKDGKSKMKIAKTIMGYLRLFINVKKPVYNDLSL